MLHFNRLQAGIYISDCGKYAIACTNYPPEWDCYRRTDDSGYAVFATRALLCLAKKAAEEDYKTNIDRR